MSNALKKRRGKKGFKYRYSEGSVVKYETKEDLLNVLRENASKNELVGPTANMFLRKAGFAIYKAVEIHLFGDNLDDDEIKSLMSEVECVVREEKNKICYQKEQIKKE